MTGHIELDAVEPTATVAMPGTAVAPVSNTLHDAYAEDARQSIAAYEKSLAGEAEAGRAARLQYEIARLYEHRLFDVDRALHHYKLAIASAPDLLPAVVGARRSALAKGDQQAALELFDREIKLLPDRQAKAAASFAKGRMLEDQLGRAAEARAAYAAAAELVEADPTLLKALEQIDLRARAWNALDEVLEREANAVASDAPLRAAIVCRRARLREVHLGDVDGAAELYASAMAFDRDAPGALAALKRLHAARGRWRDLIDVLEREAEIAADASVRAMALLRVGQIQAERLGNRKEAIAALERSAAQAPGNSAALDLLARLYEEAGDPAALSSALARLIESIEEPSERIAYLHRLGDVAHAGLGDDATAIGAYEAALAIDAAYIPVLRALAPLYAAAERWDDLVRMHVAEAGATADKARRAVAHARAAEILEQTGNDAEATEHHEHAIALDPEHAVSFKALVRLYARAERWHALVELHERALARVDVDRRIEFLFKIGDIAWDELEDADLAEHAYRRILQAAPKHLGAIHALQRLAESADRPKTLVDALELEAKLLGDKRETAALLHRAGEVLDERLAKRAEAIARFRKVLELDRLHAATLASLGRIHHAEGRWNDLVEIYGRELEAAGEGPVAVALLHRIGDVYARELAQPDKAIERYRKALELDPRHGPSAMALSQILRERGAWDELVALAELERDGFRSPIGRAHAAFRAGQIYEERLGKREQAERCYAQALELRPGYLPAADALARVRTELSRWNELAEELERDASTQHEPMLAVASLVRAGEIWSDHLRSPERAIACYEKVLERDPEHLGALLAIETLYRQVGKLAELADLHERQERVFTDMGAKAAAQRERARALTLAGLGDGDDRVACHSAILAVRPRDHLALADLEREALAGRDPRVIASVDARLAQITADATLRASYLTRRAEALEIAGQPQALEVFREALADDPENLAALRGLARVAEVIGDGAAMVEAARQEALASRDPRSAAEAWAKSGGVHADLLGEPEAAIEDFAEALQNWPDHAVAAARLSELMHQAGRLEELAERLSRAAGEAASKERKSALTIEVTELFAGELGNLGAGLAVLERHLAAQPNDTRGLLVLAQLYVEDRRHQEAIDVLRKCVALEADATVRLRVHDLSAAAYQALGDSAAAFRHYEQALALAPDDRELLARVFDLQMGAGMSSAAADTAARLLALAGEGPVRATALVALGRARAASRKIGEAIEAFVQAVVLEGPGGTAGSEFAKLATEPDHWRAYVEALRRHLHAGAGTNARAALHLEIARVLAERLGAEDQAMTMLAEGLHATGDPGLRYELALRLRQRRRHVEAVEQLQGVIMDDVTRVEAWRLLGQTFEELQRPRERVMTLAGLVVLGSASAREIEDVRRWQPWTSAIRPGSLANDAAADLYVARDQQSAPSALLASIVEGLAKVRPPELSHYGVSSRDRLPPKSDHPLRQLVDPLAAAFGLEEFDLFVHGQRERGIVVENTAKPSVLVPLWLGELPRAQQVYALAQPLCSLSRGLHVVDLFTPRELEILFAAAIRGMVPSWGERVANADVLDDQGRLIQRGIVRKKRRAYEVAAEACARAPALDVATFVQWTRQSSRRVALLVADDLIAAITHTTRTEDTGGRAGVALVRHSPVIADLLRAWVSKPAMALRRQIGIVAPGMVPSAATPATPGVRT